MKPMRFLAPALAMLVALPCFAQIESNKTLASLYAEDQADRGAKPKDIDWSVVGPRDEARRTATMRILQAGEVRTAADYHAAAMIFQHGATPEDIARTVLMCPSGALHFEPKDGIAEKIPDENRIILWLNGPLQFQGDLVIDGATVELHDETRATLCRCGESKSCSGASLFWR